MIITACSALRRPRTADLRIESVRRSFHDQQQHAMRLQLEMTWYLRSSIYLPGVESHQPCKSTIKLLTVLPREEYNILLDSLAVLVIIGSAVLATFGFVFRPPVEQLSRIGREDPFAQSSMTILPPNSSLACEPEIQLS
ncbi:hypothetical protein BDV59DRAFT_170350 [Aspergillus ambiguus]|uniref:uncharacterized protein n=1 Tax=Aspergillus ambiguus TaxID=176160 RepID=UPI003CCE2904